MKIAWDQMTFYQRYMQARPNQGDVDRAAAFAGLNPGSLSRWNKQIPSLDSVFYVAQGLGVSPAWLAFGLGPKDLAAAQAGFSLGEQLAQFPGLRGLMAYYMHLPPDERQAMLTLLKIPAEPAQTSGARERIPAGTTIEQLAPGQKLYRPPPQAAHETSSEETVASEPVPAYGKRPMNVLPIVDRPKPLNERSDLAVFKVSKRSSRAPIKLPKWYGLACGGGRELQKCPDYLYFRELPDWKNHHSAVVRGDSMRETLLPNDIVILRMLNNSEGVALEPLDSEDLKGPMQRLQAYVPPRSICVVRINDEEPTLKRVLYHAGGTAKDWKLTIAADNPAEWEPRPIGLKDHVIFYATVIGLAQE